MYECILATNLGTKNKIIRYNINVNNKTQLCYYTHSLSLYITNIKCNIIPQNVIFFLPNINFYISAFQKPNSQLFYAEMKC